MKNVAGELRNARGISRYTCIRKSESANTEVTHLEREHRGSGKNTPSAQYVGRASSLSGQRVRQDLSGRMGGLNQSGLVNNS
jgi:hypothetical protein